MSDPQDRAESLDDDRIGSEFPPEEPASDDYGVTNAEERHGEPLAERIQREEPDGPVVAEEPLVQPVTGEDEDRLDEEKDLVADAEITRSRPEGDPSGEVTRRDAPADERVPPPAEEAAIHIDEREQR